MKYLFPLISMLLLISCENDGTDRNPFIPEANFRFDLNLNLPLYSRLSNVGNPVHVTSTGVGIRGAFVMQITPDTFFAFEASCPNHAPNECSTMTIDGQNVECACEGFTYNLFTGLQLDRPDDGNRYYNLVPYRAVLSGNSVIISN